MASAMKIYFVLLGGALLFSPNVKAQMGFGAGAYVGGGAYFGQSGCAGGVTVPRSVAKIEAKMKKNEKDLKNADRDLKEAERKAEKTKREFEKTEAAIKGWLKPHVASGAILRIMEGGSVVTQNPGEVCENDSLIQSAQNVGKKLPWDSYCKTESSSGAALFTPEAEEWSAVTVTAGSFDLELCNSMNFVATNNHEILDSIHNIQGPYSGTNNKVQDCRKALEEYKTKLDAKNFAGTEVQRLTELVEQYEQKDDELMEDKESSATGLKKHSSTN